MPYVQGRHHKWQSLLTSRALQVLLHLILLNSANIGRVTSLSLCATWGNLGFGPMNKMLRTCIRMSDWKGFMSLLPSLTYMNLSCFDKCWTASWPWVSVLSKLYSGNLISENINLKCLSTCSFICSHIINSSCLSYKMLDIFMNIVKRAINKKKSTWTKKPYCTVPGSCCPDSLCCGTALLAWCSQFWCSQLRLGIGFLGPLMRQGLVWPSPRSSGWFWIGVGAVQSYL